MISETQPYQKRGYNVIKSITLNSEDIFNSKIMLSDSLTSIIGGRSSGKSLLLGTIAKKIDINKKTYNWDPGYSDLVSQYAETAEIEWGDNSSDSNKNIEYFPQGSMFSYAKDPKELNDFIIGIVRNDCTENLFLSFENDIFDNKTHIEQSILEYFRLLEKISKLNEKTKNYPEEKNIRSEIKSLEKEKSEIPVDSNIIQDEFNEHSKLELELTSLNADIDILSKDKNRIICIKERHIDASRLVDISLLSSEQTSIIQSEFNKLIEELEEKWIAFLDVQLSKITSIIDSKEKRIVSIKNMELYKKISDYLSKNSKITELTKKIDAEATKLKEIRELNNTLLNTKTSLASKLEEIKSLNYNLYEETNNFIANINKNLLDSVSKGDVEVRPEINIKENEIQEFLRNSLSLKGAQETELADANYIDIESYKENISNILKIINEKTLKFKGAWNNESFLKGMIAENFFEVKYNLIYEGDVFNQMSEGKKAFVILKLLLEKGKKECPILIDQPEDDLDNRAIYSDLVAYLKTKKKERQIILVTHNPNVVLAADSELVIIANQNGVKNQNKDSKKFAYISGAIEDGNAKDLSNLIILESQGVREHICEILEGGNEAFKKRESKYQF